MRALGLGIPVGLLAFFLFRLFLFPFLFLGRAQASCFQNIRLFFGRLTHALMHFLPKSETALPGKEVTRHETHQFLSKSQRERL